MTPNSDPLATAQTPDQPTLDEDSREDARQQRLVDVLDRYVSSLEAGEDEPIEAIRARHPDLAEDLAECLEGVRVIHTAVEAAKATPLHDARPSGDSPDEDPTIDLPHDGQARSNRSEKPPRTIGDYRLLREIGRGGMGIVYEAEEQSLSRRVALKVLPFSAVLDQRQIARFRNEAQAAAALHHPHIVPVFAIGQHRGVHYYAMPIIEGQSLAQAIAELKREAGQAPSEDNHAAAESLPAEASLRLTNSPRNTRGAEVFFRTVAQLGADAAEALHHAHQQGIVHRDIKPSNLLLDLQGQVWVADFGLARMLSDLNATAGVTATGDVVGTLRYMSPEQARGRADQIDGRTDVYALGATLYELLTLRHAHQGEGRQQILENLRGSEPIPPRRIDPNVPADLENIVLRAMEKDRDSRYTTAAELADDLRRYLDGRPTVARPPTVAQRAGKWARRHRRLVGLAAVATALIAMVSIASALLIAREQSRTAAALADSEAQNARAERLLDGARAMLDRFGGDLTDRLALLPGGEGLRRETLEQTLAYHRRFLAEADGDPGLAASAAMTRVRAAAAAERLGQTKEAVQLYAEAGRALETLLSASPDDPEVRAWLARCLTNRASLRREAGDSRGALLSLDRAVSLRRELLAEKPRSPEPMAELAAALCERSRLGKKEAAESLGEAIELLERARRIAPRTPLHTRRLAVAYNTKSQSLRARRPEEAARASNRAVELLAALIASEPEIDAYRDDLAVAFSNQAALAADRGEWKKSAAVYGAAVKELARLAGRDRLAPRRRSELAVALANQALALSRGEEAESSDAAFDWADRTLASLADDYPTESKYRRSRAALWNNRGVAQRDAGRLREAADSFARSIAIEEDRLAVAPPGSPTLLTVHYANHAQVLNRLGREKEAAESQKRRLALESRLVEARADAKVNGVQGP